MTTANSPAGKRVAAIVGSSGSGKTTLICSLIPRLAADGTRVAVIKHTHHPLNEENRGDTSKFLAAGASPVLLAGRGDAVVFEGGRATGRVSFASPDDVPTLVDADIVLVEGFKEDGSWPRIRIDAANRLDADEALAILDRIWHS